MGLIKQCDDQLGRVFNRLRETGELDETMIVVTSDHGDYLGDHWLGEKDLFHDPSVRVPLIVFDPSPEADSTRGTVCDELVEGIDLAATFIEAAGGEVPDHIIEGRSLLPHVHNNTVSDWREFAVSEYDYSATPMAAKLGLAPRDARLFMIADKRWKFMHAEGGFRPMLFDRESDPKELVDLGASASHRATIDLMYERLGRWARRMSQRTTKSESDILAMRGKSRRKGILLGVYDGTEVDEELLSNYQGKVDGKFSE